MFCVHFTINYKWLLIPHDSLNSSCLPMNIIFIKFFSVTYINKSNHKYAPQMFWGTIHKTKNKHTIFHTNTTNAKEHSTKRHLNVQLHKENEVNNAYNKDFCKWKHILKWLKRITPNFATLTAKFFRNGGILISSCFHRWILRMRDLLYALIVRTSSTHRKFPWFFNL